jgi:hypothetical protein
MIFLSRFLVFCLFFFGMFSKSRALDFSADPQKVASLKEFLSLKKEDIDKNLEMYREILQKMRLSISEKLGRAYVLKQVFDLQKRYGDGQDLAKRGHLFLCIKRSATKEWAAFLSAKEQVKILENQKLKIAEALKFLESHSP